ncbi:hypothetical protein D3C75_1283400 [compost metagenome]
MPLQQQVAQPQYQNADHGVTGGEAFEGHVGHNQQPCQGRVDRQAGKGADAELQQNTRQQSGRHASGDDPHQALEAPGQP